MFDGIFNDLSMSTFLISAAIILLSWSYIAKTIKKTLTLGVISVSIYTFVIYIHGVDQASLAIGILGILSMLIGLLSSNRVKDILFKIIPFLSIAIVFILDYSVLTILPALALFFSSLGSLSTNLFTLKIFSFLSNSVWLAFGFMIMSPHAIIFDTIGNLALIYFFISQRKGFIIYLKSYANLNKK